MTIAKVQHINSPKYQHLVGRRLKVVHVFRCPETGKVKVTECRVWSREYNRYITLAFYNDEVSLGTMYPSHEAHFLVTRTGGKPSRKRLAAQIV
jgi:hypothetical protein